MGSTSFVNNLISKVALHDRRVRMPITHVDQNVYVSGRLPAESMEALQALHITCVVSVAFRDRACITDGDKKYRALHKKPRVEYPYHARMKEDAPDNTCLDSPAPNRTLVFHHVPVHGHLEVDDIYNRFQEVSAIVEQASKVRFHRILIHCELGINESLACAAFCLMKKLSGPVHGRRLSHTNVLDFAVKRRGDSDVSQEYVSVLEMLEVESLKR